MTNIQLLKKLQLVLKGHDYNYVMYKVPLMEQYIITKAHRIALPIHYGAYWNDGRSKKPVRKVFNFKCTRVSLCEDLHNRRIHQLVELLGTHT